MLCHSVFSFSFCTIYSLQAMCLRNASLTLFKLSYMVMSNRGLEIMNYTLNFVNVFVYINSLFMLFNIVIFHIVNLFLFCNIVHLQ
jgi:hypothetical protein